MPPKKISKLPPKMQEKAMQVKKDKSNLKGSKASGKPAPRAK